MLQAVFLLLGQIRVEPLVPVRFLYAVLGQHQLDQLIPERVDAAVRHDQLTSTEADDQVSNEVQEELDWTGRVVRLPAAEEAVVAGTNRSSES